MDLKKIIGKLSLARKLFSHISSTGVWGLNAFRDMRRLGKGGRSPIIFDVGANMGQSIRRFKGIFQDANIHAFEPSEETFHLLQKKTKRFRKIKYNNIGLGAKRESATFMQNIYSDMSSFLEPDEDCWGKIENTKTVNIETLDHYCKAQQIRQIDVLKTDTQGYDFEVIKGGQSLLENNSIHMIYMEIIFSNMYKNLPRFDEVYRFLIDHHFKLVSCYTFRHQHSVASWCNALFVNPSYGRLQRNKSASKEHKTKPLA